MKPEDFAGGEPRFVVKTGTSDMNVVGPHWSETAIVAYGPGDSSLDHTPNEHIDVREYEKSVDVLSQVLQQLVRPCAVVDGRRQLVALWIG